MKPGYGIFIKSSSETKPLLCKDDEFSDSEFDYVYKNGGVSKTLKIKHIFSKYMKIFKKKPKYELLSQEDSFYSSQTETILDNSNYEFKENNNINIDIKNDNINDNINDINCYKSGIINTFYNSNNISFYISYNNNNFTTQTFILYKIYNNLINNNNKYILQYLHNYKNNISHIKYYSNIHKYINNINNHKNYNMNKTNYLNNIYNNHKNIYHKTYINYFNLIPNILIYNYISIKWIYLDFIYIFYKKSNHISNNYGLYYKIKMIYELYKKLLYNYDNNYKILNI